MAQAVDRPKSTVAYHVNLLAADELRYPTDAPTLPEPDPVTDG